MSPRTFWREHPLPARGGLAPVLIVAGVANGMLMLGVGRSLGPEAPVAPVVVVECSGFPAEPPARGAAIRLTAPGPEGASAELLFLDAAGGVLRAQHADLIAGARTSIGLPARELGSALRVTASGDLDVGVALAADPDGAAAPMPVCSRRAGRG